MSFAVVGGTIGLGTLLREMVDPEPLDPLFVGFLALFVVFIAGLFVWSLCVARFGRMRIVIDATGIHVNAFIGGHRQGLGSHVPWGLARATSIVSVGDCAYLTWGSESLTETLPARFSPDQAAHVLLAIDRLRESAADDPASAPVRSAFRPRLVIASVGAFGSLVAVWLATQATGDAVMYRAMDRQPWTAFLATFPWQLVWLALTLALGLPGAAAFAAARSRRWAPFAYAGFVGAMLAAVHWLFVALPAQQVAASRLGGW